MSMSVAEARSEIANLFTKANEIEAKYPEGPITNNEDETEVKRLLTEIDGLESKLAALEEAEGRRARVQKGLRDYLRPTERMQHADPADDSDPNAGKSVGQIFTDAEMYRSLKAQGQFNSPHNVVAFTVPLEGQHAKLLDTAMLQRKALVYSGSAVGGPLIQPDRAGSVLPYDVRERTILDVISRIPTESDTFEYYRINTFTNNAAPTAEATVTTGTSGTKPESALATQKLTTPIKTIAHWMAVTNKMLADAPAMRGLIDQHLLLGLELALEDEIIAGDGTGEHLTGILSAGIQTYGAGSSANVADAVLHARAMVRVVGQALPNAAVMHPYDWEAIRIMRENAATGTLGGYLMGPPMVAGPVTLWGMPVIEAQGITQNTALVGDFRTGATLLDREQAQIRVGVINDQFVRNMQTILAELRAGLVVWRPNAFVRITGV